jgi:hypothetical protein
MKVIIENPEYKGEILEMRLNGEDVRDFSPNRITSQRLVIEVGALPKKGRNILEILTANGGYIRRYLEI